MSGYWKFFLVWTVLLAIVILAMVCIRFPVATWIVAPLAVVLLVVGYLALCCTITPDGQAKRVDRLGAFRRIILQWNGHSLNNDGDITDIPAARSVLGGFRWVSWLKPFGIDKVYITPEFKYSKIEVVDKRQTVVPHTLTNINYVLVRPDVFGIMVQQQETSASTGERIPIDAIFAVGVRVVNPEKNTTQAPTNWWEKTEARLASMKRGWIAATSLDDILGVKGTSGEMMRIINQIEPDFIPSLERDWGERIEKIELVDVILPPEIQKAANAKREQEMQAGGLAASTATAELAMVSAMSGIPLKDLQARIKAGIDAAVAADPVHGLENWIKANPKYWDLIQKKQLGIRPLLVGDASGGQLDPLVQLLAIYQSLKGGNASGGNPTDDPAGGQGNQGRQKKGGRKKQIQDMTDEEKDEEWKNMTERNP